MYIAPIRIGVVMKVPAYDIADSRHGKRLTVTRSSVQGDDSIAQAKLRASKIRMCSYCPFFLESQAHWYRVEQFDDRISYADFLQPPLLEI